MATEDVRYRQSTQYRLWSFTPARLAEMRAESNALARKAIGARLQSSNPPVDPLPDFLTPAEEADLLYLYTNELLAFATHCELPSDVRATAAVFFRRFYVTNSIMTYPPQKLYMTAIFFGCKADGYYMRLAKFAGMLPKPGMGDEVLAAEYILCQGIRFAFDVRHPYRALEGAVMQLRHQAGFDARRIDSAHARARDVLKYSPLVTDAYFHYAPSQIMFASLAIADEELFESLMRPAFQGQDEGAKAKVMAVIHECRDMLAREPPENYPKKEARDEATKGLRKKLKKCRDPDRFDLVALQRARKEQAEAKAKKPKSTMKDDGDVFGGAMDIDRDHKRVKKENDDPFGPALG